MATAMTSPDNTILQLLNHALRDPDLNQEQREKLWSQATAAHHASIQSPSEQTPSDVPRSMAINAQHPAPFLDVMSRAQSIPSFVSMERSASSASNYGSFPQYTSSSIPWMAPDDTFVDGYTHQPLPASMQQHPSVDFSNGGLSCQTNKGLVEYNNPADFISTFNEPSSSPSLSFPQMCNSQQLQIPLTQDMSWGLSTDGSISPSTPALMTPATMSSSNMSRQSSYNPFTGGEVPMLRIPSDSSSISHPVLNYEDGSFISYSSLLDAKTSSACAASSQFPTSFTGPANEVFPLSISVPPSGSSHPLGSSSQQQSDLVEDMRRSASISSGASESGASTASASSTTSRQSQRNREINAQAASRKIAPKSSDTNLATQPATSDVQMKRVVSEDGSSKDLARIAKAPYIRPQHPRMMCPYCDRRPEGFRGTHELERHVQRSHSVKRKGYICVDASDNGKWLSKCKHCRGGKVYGAYYNAAAHLRRTHFHPRKRGRKGKNDEKRGGIGGGDDPPMDYLKQHWIKEIDVDSHVQSKPQKKQKQQQPVQFSDESDDSLIEMDVDVDDSIDHEDNCQNVEASSAQNMMPGSLEHGDIGDPALAQDSGSVPIPHCMAYDDCPFTDNDCDFEFDAYIGS